MTARIIELWRRERSPSVDGLYWASGQARAVHVDSAELSSFTLGPPLDLDEVFANPTDVSAADISARAELPGGAGSVVCGEGAHGSEGFFARMDAEGELVWIVPLRWSNPFHQVRVDGTLATFTNNLGNSITVDLDSSDFGPAAPHRDFAH